MRRLTKTSPEGRKTFTFFNSKNKVIRDSTAGLTAVTYQYDSFGRRTQANQGGRITTFEYDSVGRQSKITDPYGRITQFFYDAADRLVRTLAPDSSEVLFTYDKNGNMTVLSPPEKPDHTFAYSGVDLETLYTPPFAGDSARATTRVYTLDKEMKKLLRPDSLNITLTYGGTGSLAGQPKTIIFDRGTAVNLYDTTKGLQTGVIAPTNDTLSYQYDGTLLKRLTWKGPNGVNSVKGDVAFTYNTDLLVGTETIFPATGGPDTVNMTYDKDGLMTKAGAMKLGYSTTTGLLNADTVGSVYTNYTYNGFGELASKETKFNTTQYFKVDFVRDSLGRITQKTEINEGDTTVFAYTYDNVGRLSEVHEDGALTAKYQYDTNGNRLKKIAGSDTTSGTYDNQDRLLTYGTTSYVYSKFGDLQKKIVGTDTTNYTYDAFGSLVSVRLPNGTLIEYLLDGNGLRVGRKANGVITQKWLYSNNLRIVVEMDSSNSIKSRFLYTTSENVPEYMVKSDTAHRIVTDHLGSVRQILNTQTGVILQKIDYDEFGNVVLDTNPGFSPFGFAGGLYEPSTKLVRFGARDYQAISGRWVTKDPILFGSRSSNHYLYTSCDPLNFADPTGTSINAGQAASAFSFVAATVGLIDNIVDLAVSGGRDQRAWGSLFLNTWGMAASTVNFERAARDAQSEQVPTDPLTLAVKQTGYLSSNTATNITTAIVAGATWAVATRSLGELTSNYSLKFAVAALSYVATIQAGINLFSR